MPRRRMTCTECSLRRQKCDRRTPCGRCVKRGVAEKCCVSWPEPYDPRIHRAYSRTRPQPSIQPPARVHSNIELTREVQFGSWIPSAAVASTHGAERQPSNPSKSLAHGAFTDHLLPKPCKRILGTDDATQSLYLQRDTGLRASDAWHIDFLQTLMPSTERIWSLVDYHEIYLLWYHGCYHGPTFKSELERALSNQGADTGTLALADLNLQWLALLFAIMAGSITCATEPWLEKWGFAKREAASLSQQWYKATISCLNEAEYTSRPEMYAVHAIATLSMAAHPLGRSQELSVMLGAALKIAQCLNLNRLDQDPALEGVSEYSKTEQRNTLLRREIGRRLWSFLCINDWMSLPFTESHSINPFHFITVKPSSRNHLTMEPIPPTFPTYTSYGNYLYDIAKLMANHHDVMLRATTQFTMFETVMEYDSRIRALATQGLPRYFHVVEPIDPLWPPWVIWARKSLTICFAHKIIMIHRAFVRQSFVNPAYAITRRTCLAASKTILNEATQTKDADGPIIWVDNAFCIVAGIVLCLDIFHRTTSELEFKTHRELVTECIGLLQRFESSVVAVRGALLLSALIDARDRLASENMWPPRVIELSDISESLVEVRDFLYASLSDSDPYLVELLPPQAGFCNRFLFEELLC